MSVSVGITRNIVMYRTSGGLKIVNNGKNSSQFDGGFLGDYSSSDTGLLVASIGAQNGNIAVTAFDSIQAFKNLELGFCWVNLSQVTVIQKAVDLSQAMVPITSTIEDSTTHFQVFQVTPQDSNGAQSLQTINIGDLISRIKRGEYKKLSKEVVRTDSRADCSIRFEQFESYFIPKEQYEITPRISSITLSCANKQRVTLEFKKNSNLRSIEKILLYHSVKYTIIRHEISPKLSINLLTIEGEGYNLIDAIAHLHNIYQEVAKEAGVLIFEAFLVIVEDALDKMIIPTKALSPDWKMHVGVGVKAWARLPDEQEKWEGEVNEGELQTQKNYDDELKKQYWELNAEEKENFLEATIKDSVKNVAYSSLSLAEQYHNRENKIREAFSTEKQCLDYVINSFPDAVGFLQNVTTLDKRELETKFGPTVLERILSNDDLHKDVKVFGSGTKAAVSLIVATGRLAKDSIPTPLWNVVNLGALFVSSAYAYNRATKKETTKPTIDKIIEILKTFYYMSVICNPKILLLDQDSQNKIMSFYHDFAYKTISGRYYGEENILDYLLTQISNPKYIDNIGLGQKANSMLVGEGISLTISSFVILQEKEQCYQSLFIKLNSADQSSLLLSYNESLPVSPTNSSDSSLEAEIEENTLLPDSLPITSANSSDSSLEAEIEENTLLPDSLSVASADYSDDLPVLEICLVYNWYELNETCY